MSMRPDFQNRDFKKNPLKRADTQIKFNPDDETEAPFRAQQHHNKDGRLDTTAIVAKAFAGGVIANTRDGSARYIDATAVSDFREAMTIKAKADQAYNLLPDEVKKEFETQQDFVKYCLDASNIEQLREWGLAPALKTTEPVKPQEVIIVNPEGKKPEEKPA